MSLLFIAYLIGLLVVLLIGTTRLPIVSQSLQVSDLYAEAQVWALRVLKGSLRDTSWSSDDYQNERFYKVEPDILRLFQTASKDRPFTASAYTPEPMWQRVLRLVVVALSWPVSLLFVLAWGRGTAIAEKKLRDALSLAAAEAELDKLRDQAKL